MSIKVPIEDIESSTIWKYQKVVIPLGDDSVEIQGFSETELNPDVTVLVETDGGQFHVEKGVEAVMDTEY